MEAKQNNKEEQDNTFCFKKRYYIKPKFKKVDK